MAKYVLRLIVLTFVCISACIVSLAQDGSDMNYIEPDKVDISYIGRLTHIDFFRNSKGCSQFWGNKQDGSKCDKITLSIGDKQIEFHEHRQDDGYNNWFKDQYLESTNKKIKIRYFKITEVDEKNFTFIGYFNVAPFEKEFVFNKKDIFKLLFKGI